MLTKRRKPLGPYPNDSLHSHDRIPCQPVPAAAKDADFLATDTCPKCNRHGPLSQRGMHWESEKKNLEGTTGNCTRLFSSQGL